LHWRVVVQLKEAEVRETSRREGMADKRTTTFGVEVTMETKYIHNYNELDQLGMYVGKAVTEDAKMQTTSV